MNIDFNDHTNTVSEEIMDLIERVLQFAAEKEKVQDDAELSISFVDNNEIQEINRDYRGKDVPTDVISFALEESVEGELMIDAGGLDIPVMLGDIIISIEKAKEQAEEYKHSYERELGFLAVHGFLHLLGYDHMNEEDEKKMFSRQEDILGEFGLER